MPRPAGISLPRYIAAAGLDRATNLKTVARLRERHRARGAADLAMADGLPVPPARLRVLVGAPDAELFLEQGRLNLQAIQYAAPPRGTVLDFGCGCGRTARYLQHAPVQLHGCDLNPLAVEWCERNLPFMTATVNPPEPPTGYPDETFDAIYAISILTHLSERRGQRWIDEWRRILKPGGTLLATTHGDAYRDRLGRRLGRRYDAGETVVKHRAIEGMNACVTHHPAARMRQLLHGFSGVRHIPGGEVPRFPQDMWVAERPAA